jgi:hypothetical protein
MAHIPNLIRSESSPSGGASAALMLGGYADDCFFLIDGGFGMSDAGNDDCLEWCDNDASFVVVVVASAGAAAAAAAAADCGCCSAMVGGSGGRNGVAAAFGMVVVVVLIIVGGVEERLTSLRSLLSSVLYPATAMLDRETCELNLPSESTLVAAFNTLARLCG